MKSKLLKIIKYYGIENQLKYIHSEYFELDEAIINAENQRFDGKYNGIPNNYKEHIASEIADCYVMMEQIRHFYNITNEELIDNMNFKIDRQLDRIKNENKEVLNNASNK